MLTYLDEVFSIPWDNYTEEIWDTKHTKKIMNEQIYGLEKVKERVYEMIAVNKLKD